MTTPSITLPPSITVEVNGTPCTALGKLNKAKTGTWFTGSVLVPELVDDPRPVLAAVSVSFEGKTLKAGEVHESAPRLYQAGHAQAGKRVPGTGGNQTVTHSASTVLGDVRYTLTVTVTYVADKGFRTTVKAIRQGASNSAPLQAEGLSFAKVAA